MQAASGIKTHEVSAPNVVGESGNEKIEPEQSSGVHQSDIMTHQEYGDLQRMCASYMTQLCETVEELNVTRRVVEDLAEECARHKASTQTFVDQRDLLYRCVAAHKISKVNHFFSIL